MAKVLRLRREYSEIRPPLPVHPRRSTVSVMHLLLPVRVIAVAALGALASLPAASQQTQPPAPVATPAQPQAETPWLFVGSDITPDPAWRFGTLPNGLRYAVRRNGVPPGQVSVRVRVDAGSLMERDDERGYAHLLEHLAFRGSEHVPDGESKRLWQRLGVTFGSDSNASTTFTQTVYKLDLPSATPQGFDESMKVLAGMMANPTITQSAIDAERPVVLAEQRERLSPQSRIGDATRALFFAGQPLAERSPIGTTETLMGATPEKVADFHRRWYRPERTVIVIAGDFDPATFVQQIEKHFAPWRGDGPNPANPDFGRPQEDQPASAVAIEPTLPPVVSFGVIRPWSIEADTVLFNQERMVDQIAIRILNRRLESRARGGGSFITAGANLEDVARSANATIVSILPVGEDWEAAVRDVRATIADAMATAPTQPEIDREVAEIDALMKNGVDTARVEPAAMQADSIVHGVDIGETVASPEVSLEIFRGAVEKKFFTPDRVLAASRKIFDGIPRAIVNTRSPDAGVQNRLAAVLEEDVSSLAQQRAQAGDVGFDDLPRLGRPGRVAARETVLVDPNIEQVRFANGTSLLVFPNDSETGRVYVRVRFGGGRRVLSPTDHGAAWAADLALVASGIGKLGQEEIDRMTSGRQIGMEFAIDDDAFVLGARTRPADLADQLRLIAAKLHTPGWDPNPVARARAVTLAGYPTLESSPDGVLARDLETLMRGGDARWGVPPRDAVEATDAKAFRAFWEPLLASGPVEVQVFGDVTAEAAIDAVARSLGALKQRPAVALSNDPPAPPERRDGPVIRTHKGQPDQAAAVIAWPTAGGSEALTESRRLDVLAAIFRDRLFDRLRSQAGASYTPNVLSDWPVGMPGGGRFFAIGQVPPDQADFFFRLAREIAADLVAKPIDTDELRRALVPVAQQMVRMSSGNTFWMQQTAGGTRDPRRIRSIDSLPQDYGTVTPADIQALAQKYLRSDAGWTMLVLPEAAAKEAGVKPTPEK
jgi:zinc protease